MHAVRDLGCWYSNRSLECFRIFIRFTPPPYYDILCLAIRLSLLHALSKFYYLFWKISSITTATTDPNNADMYESRIMHIDILVNKLGIDNLLDSPTYVPAPPTKKDILERNRSVL